MRRSWGAAPRTRRIGQLTIVVEIAGVLGLLWLAVVVAPPWFVDDESLEGLKAQNEVRTTLLQGLAGVVLLVGAYFTYRQLHTAREGQITERYTRAIDQLGHAEVDVRLGGIYALERIARDSRNDRVTIGEVLTAFIRTHAPWPPSLPGQYVATAPISQVPYLQVRAPDVQASLTVLGRGGFSRLEGKGGWLDLTAVDLRRATLSDALLEGANLYRAHLELAMLFRVQLKGANLGEAHLKHAILNDAHLEEANLQGAHLEHAILNNAHLEEADLLGAHLERALLSGTHLERALLADCHMEKAALSTVHLEEANLSGAHMTQASLTSAHMEEAALFSANLRGANLRNAYLEKARLREAWLEKADLRGAHLQMADLSRAHLKQADLSGADMDETVLLDARLEGAKASQHTRWPAGFDWRAAGVIIVSEISERSSVADHEGGGNPSSP